MPGYPWYFREESKIRDEHIVVPIPDGFKPAGKSIVAKQEAIDLVRYLQSLKQVEIE
jgi:cytochrome c oxidase cbb3-type subunit 2